MFGFSGAPKVDLATPEGSSTPPENSTLWDHTLAPIEVCKAAKNYVSKCQGTVLDLSSLKWLTCQTLFSVAAAPLPSECITKGANRRAVLSSNFEALSGSACTTEFAENQFN